MRSKVFQRKIYKAEHPNRRYAPYAYDTFSQATYPHVWGGGVLRITFFLYLVKNHVTLLPDCITPAFSPCPLT